ncbi:MAG TPA: tripartite tricarboxylate transporter substrate binding protein [Aurantimonas coralicida]|uniref:Tripartite tricarboxylate transporter substrate binding protein n=2 Tax=root TaxID=1 RepID=A0A9C9NH43_9HYPH|nr:tripartite tricarboxylate transporter substrate binding protein [Aurantimonas coralicida]HEU01376.1 tripartite tricarboxylate transporter substrate binding protein [Aurantimonas coralicida]
MLAELRNLTIAGAVTLSALTGLASSTQAQEYPERAVEFIVPWGPGGGSDTLMRIIANNAEPFLGQPLAVINMPGVGGTVGLTEASKREANGYTISQVHEGLPVANKTGLTDINWDTFDPIALMTSSPQYLVVRADSPWKTFEEFVAHAKENPGEIKTGVTLGGVPHLHAAMIEDAAGIELSYVGYEGTGERIRALVGGNLDAAIGDVSSSLEFVKNGDLRFLATGAAERLEATPDVPTLKELGHDLELTITRGIVMPKGAPEETRKTLESALEKLSEDAAFVEQINNAGAEVDFRGQEEYRTYLEKLDATIDRLVGRLAG